MRSSAGAGGEGHSKAGRRVDGMGVSQKHAQGLEQNSKELSTSAS
ncbi:MAG TPA: hypothetical protein VIH03_02910 [Nitrososphaerales archaeon]